MSKQLGVLFLTIFIDLLGFGIIIPILPIISTELQATPLQIGLIAGIYSLMNFLFSPFWGTLSDRIGRRPVMLISIAITMLASFFFAFTTNLLFLVFARVFSGIGSANIGAAQAYIADVTPIEKRAGSMGLLGAAFGLGFIFGPPLGGYLKALSGPGSVWYVGAVSAALSFLNLILAWFFLKESIQQKQNHKAFRFAPVNDILREIKTPVIREVMWLNFVFIMAFSMMQISSTLFWKDVFGLDEKQIGWVFMYIGVVGAFIQGFLVGKLNRMLSGRQLLVYGVVLMAAGLFLMTVYPNGVFWPQLLALTVLSLGNGFLSPAISSTISRYAGPNRQGQVLGSNLSFSSLARVAGPALGGWLYGFAAFVPFLTGGLFMLVSLVLLKSIPDEKSA
ncbi:MAG: MFS transporter [Bacteroidia bacterium]|nr:MFS transporter [Bacteroidia bacterium]